jgi:hypothetical protein
VTLQTRDYRQPSGLGAVVVPRGTHHTPLSAASLSAMASHGEKIMSHWIKTGVHHLIIHREHENAVEVLFQSPLKRFTGFAVDVTNLALR